MKSTIRTVIRFLWVSAKFGTCTVVSVHGALVESKMCTFTLESTHFIFHKCPFTLMTAQVLNLELTLHGTVFSVVLQPPWRTPPRSAWQTCAALTAAWGSGGSGPPARPPAALRSEGRRSPFHNLIQLTLKHLELNSIPLHSFSRLCWLHPDKVIQVPYAKASAHA